MRVTARKTEKNRKIKGSFRSAVKKTLEAISSGNVTQAEEWQKKAQIAIDKAAQKKVIHKNNAARKKSRLNDRLKAMIKK